MTDDTTWNIVNNCPHSLTKLQNIFMQCTLSAEDGHVSEDYHTDTFQREAEPNNFSFDYINC
ncbi:hypothetical protein Mapa_017586 [Marchantia paleacea]|nr:hypothetical protein Mapa_017586 [Marchantia paleacea]